MSPAVIPWDAVSFLADAPVEHAFAGCEVLLVEDHPVYLRTLARSFASAGLIPLTAHTSAEALELVSRSRPRFAIIDLFLEPPDDGLRLLEQLKLRRPDLNCVIVSAHMSVAHAVLAIKAGASDVFLKPFNAHQALERIAKGPVSLPEAQALTLDQIEWEHISRVVEDYDGNISHAAEALGILRQSLQRKLRRYAPRVLRNLPRNGRPRRKRPR